MEPVISGVPQGSVLGPLLFLILMGDIDEGVVSSLVSSFADDTRVLGSIADTEDVDRLQVDLNTIYEWSNNNNAKFNPDKFECIRYGNKQPIKISTSYHSNSDTVQKLCTRSRRDSELRCNFWRAYIQYSSISKFKMCLDTTNFLN